MTRLYFISLLVFVTCTAVVNGDVEEEDYYDETWNTEGGSCSDEYSDTSEESPDVLTCGPNESINNCPIDCPSDYCPRSEAESKQTLFCPQPKVCPPPKCKCNINHRRARNGTCIATTSCPPFKCSGENEEFNACPPMCPTDDCSQASPTGKCPIFGRIGIVLICNPKCRCKKGYWRKNGKCVPYAQCSTGGEVTVKPPEQLQCGRNEVVKCVKKCPLERTCARQVINYLCVRDPTPCKNKCVCADGYLRNSIGECITKEQCAKCTKPNEFFSCGSACDNECRTYPKQSKINCPIKNIKCTERCYCNDGYARDDKGNCVPIDQCKPKCSDPNENYVLGKSCPPDTCFSIVARFKCDSNEPDQYRCRCKSGYFRIKAGTKCVPMCKCPQIANSPECAAENLAEVS